MNMITTTGIHKHNCIFCSNEINNRTIYRTKYSRIIIAKHYLHKGQLLIIPIRHVENYLELYEDEINDMFQSVKISQGILMKKFLYQEFNIIMNLGSNSGQTIPHLHVHIVPRMKDDVTTPKNIFSEEFFNKLNVLEKNEMKILANDLKLIE